MERRLLGILGRCRSLTQVQQAQVQVVVHGFGQSNPAITALIAAALALRCPAYSLRIFETFRHPEVALHNFMIKCFNENGLPGDAISMYNRMRSSGVWPNNFTFSFVVRTCSVLGSLGDARQAHGQIMRCGWGSHVFVLNCLLDVYGSTGGAAGLRIARKVFDGMGDRDVVSWNSMANAYMACGDRNSAMRLFEQMPERSIVSWNLMLGGLVKAGDMGLARSVFDRIDCRNELTWNTMINGYVMQGNMSMAREIFDKMVNKTTASWTAMISGFAKIGDLESVSEFFAKMPVKNVVSWNAVIAAYNQNFQFDQALRVFRMMLCQGEVVPDEVTLVSVVSACAHLGSLEHGRWVHSYIFKNKIHVSTSLGNALIDMFAKCGDVESAYAVFFQSTARCVITWTTMISGLGLNGKCREAVTLFELMCEEDGLKLDDVAFLAALTACAHGGLVEEGRHIFDRMVLEFNIKPRAKHYGCIVDLLARAGKLQEAIQFIESMPMEPEGITWASLLSSCKTYEAAELVSYLTRRISEKNPLDPAHQVLVSNSQASAKRWLQVAEIRGSLRWGGVDKVPGCSTIQVGGVVHEFLVKDTRHEMMEEVYEALDGLNVLLLQADYHSCTQVMEKCCAEI